MQFQSCYRARRKSLLRRCRQERNYSRYNPARCQKRWPGFLRLGRTMLLASGFHPDTLVFRDARKKNWQRGLGEVAAVVCDYETATGLTVAGLRKTRRVVVFSLLSQASIRVLQDYIKFLA